MAAVAAFASLLAVAATAQTERPVDEADETASAVASRQSGLDAGLDDPWAAVEPEFANHESRAVRRRALERASPPLAAKSDKGERRWLRTFGALAGVVGLIVFLAWGYRAMTGGNLPLLGKARRPGLIEVVSKTPLSPRQSLCLVRIGPRLVLIGQSQETLRALDVIDNPDLAASLVGEAAQTRPDSSQAEFTACLEREARRYHQREDGVNETILPEARRIADVRQGVTNTIRRIRRAVTQV
ncbi:MAG: FliO/MopB family protein [Phycisphaerae bacterium]